MHKLFLRHFLQICVTKIVRRKKKCRLRSKCLTQQFWRFTAPQCHDASYINYDVGMQAKNKIKMKQQRAIMIRLMWNVYEFRKVSIQNHVAINFMIMTFDKASWAGFSWHYRYIVVTLKSPKKSEIYEQFDDFLSWSPSSRMLNMLTISCSAWDKKTV